jgi:hypothetical protein
MIHTARFGHGIRMLQEAGRTARPLDQPTVQRLMRAREEAPAPREREFDAAIEEAESDIDRAYLERLRERPEGYASEREVFDELLLGDSENLWLERPAFVDLSGYSEPVWHSMAVKATSEINASLAQDDPDARLFPWEAVDHCLRLGYVVRCGDEFNGYVPEQVDGGDWHSQPCGRFRRNSIPRPPGVRSSTRTGP